ncbi:AAA family ATPase [Rhizobium sp. WL3]|uniref:AAA family ATPase n=1 Tax=Rhizobium sp. WL3 TaxID=2603277 RepID=UPI0016504BCC|nr:AAA family ATPase [Rhizobium sp. WL3]
MNQPHPFPPIEAYERDLSVEADVAPLKVRSAATLQAKPIPPREWVVEDWIPAKTVTILNGDGAAGKSLLALQLAICAASGGYWCGREVQPGRSIFISAEDDEDELHRRLADIARGGNLSLSDLNELLFRSLAGEDAILAVAEGKGSMLKPTRLFHQLEKLIAAQRPTLVVLDTLADMFGGDEINRTHARQFIGFLRGFCTSYGATVVLLAHPSLSGMASGNGSSGSTAWSNSSRSRLYLERVKEGVDEPDPDLRILSKKKINYGRAGDQIKLRWIDGVFKPESAPDSFVAMAAQNATDRLFLDLLAQLSAQGRDVSDTRGANYAPSIFTKDPRANGTTSKGFEGAMMRLFAEGKIRIEMKGPPSKRRKSIVAT